MNYLKKVIYDKVHRDGFAFIPEACPAIPTLDLAMSIGNIFDIKHLYPNLGLDNIQKLKPKKEFQSSKNKYSGVFGTKIFPFHTDLAHWETPPRYMMLRCISGFKEVTTNLLPLSVIENSFDKNIINFSLVTVRRKTSNQKICPMPIIFEKNNNKFIRWDSLFLEPLNEDANTFYSIFNSNNWSKKDIKSFCLENKGDLLVIDNWKILHSRSEVPDSAVNREIERVYFNSIG
jgi:hypothetical protein